MLNELLLERIDRVSDKAILELGAGNGYFLHLAIRHFSGQHPKRLVLSDQSEKLLSIAQSNFSISGAEYLKLDVRGSFPFEDKSFDLILATMIFNEVSTGGVKRALAECDRVLRPDGLLLITVTHPAFIASLKQRDLLKKNKRGNLTMPGSNQMRLPIVPRSLKDYERLLSKSGYPWEATDVYLTKKVLNEKPGLRHVRNVPLGLILACRK